MTLAELLKTTRQKALLSQESFSKVLNVSVVTINRWENGKMTPNINSMSNLKSFCMERDIPFNELERLWLQSKRRGSNGTDL